MRWMISLLLMKRKSIHPMEWKVSFHRMNAFYISLLTMKSSIAFGTVYFSYHIFFTQKILLQYIKEYAFKKFLNFFCLEVCM
jgi:hypothetical protein